MIEAIIDSIQKTRKPVSEIEDLPCELGIYTFFIGDTTDLGKFGKKGQVIYVGKAEERLSARELEQHLAEGETGWSTFRRSLGAILKTKLNLQAVRRDPYPKPLKPANYKFTDGGESSLSKWMLSHLEFGYWSAKKIDRDLESLEMEVMNALKPKLNIKHAKAFNPFVNELKALRKICSDEVKNSED